MSVFYQHKEFYNQPILLTEEDKQNPHLVMERFFDDYSLVEVRERLEEARTACQRSNFPPFDDGTERTDQELFFSHLTEIVEASQLLVEATKKKKTKWEYTGSPLVDGLPPHIAEQVRNSINPYYKQSLVRVDTHTVIKKKKKKHKKRKKK